MSSIFDPREKPSLIAIKESIKRRIRLREKCAYIDGEGAENEYKNLILDESAEIFWGECTNNFLERLEDIFVEQT